MTSMFDQELAETETLLRQRLTQLADHAPTAVRLPGEVSVVATNRPVHQRRRVGAIVAVTALIGAGGFTTYSILGAANDTGAATPEEAVTTFVSAMEHEDLLGMIDVTLPEEVNVLRAAVESSTSDAKRVGLLSDQFDAGGLRGLDITVDDLALETTVLEGGLAAVTATNGTLSASFDPQSFPFGDRVKALVGNAEPVGGAALELSGGDRPAVLMTVQHGGRWYVSLQYTVAEYIRRAEGWEVPAPVTRTPIGFDLPEEAVTAFYDRLASLDLQSAFDTFAPGEDAIAWLAQSWIADAQAAIDRGRADGWSVTISGLSYETIVEGDHLTLRPQAFVVSGTLPDESSGQPQPFRIERSDGCTTFTGAAASMFGLETSPLANAVDGGGYRVCGGGDALGGFGLFLLSGGTTDLPPISVVQSGGKWYVSPLGTVLASASTALHDIKDGSSLFDSALAPYIYAGMSRAWLESLVVGQNADTINPDCRAALTVDNGIVTGVVADPSPAAVQSCDVFDSIGSNATGSSSAPAIPAAIEPPPPIVEGTPVTTAP
jgi:hypothetical protein